jgi:serine/threonine protein kinase
MSTFRPHTRTLLPIGSALYSFVPHPLFPEDEQEVFVMEGGEAFVYKLQHMGLKTFFALKVMKPGFRDVYSLKVAQCLEQHSTIPGLYLAHRVCLTKEQYPSLIGRYPDLEYAVLCPWIEGRTWAGLMMDPAASALYSFEHAKGLALALSYVLWNLEAHSLAHTDIAGGNVLLGPDFKQVQLIDLESMYIPNVKLPKKQSRGSPGYQLSQLDNRGQCCPEGDRFAGAIMLTEMLSWWHPSVRAVTPDDAESLFAPNELQRQDFPCWRRVRKVLYQCGPAILDLFDQAWQATSLKECPDFGSWSMALVSAFM